MSKLISASAVARDLGVSPNTVTRWVDAGIIKPEFQIGKLIRFDLDKTKSQLAKASKRPAKPRKVKGDIMLPTY